MRTRACHKQALAERTSMSILQGIGACLIIAGVVEFVLFRILAPRTRTIARRIRLLNANALLNTTVGVILLIVGG
jgi:hypothetical protein